MSNIESQKGEIVMYQPDETIRLEVKVENETVWLNRQQLATLFDRDVKTIGKHINNALKEELVDLPTVANFAIVQIEGDSIDNYIDETTLTILSKRASGVTATIYTHQLAQKMHQLQLDIQRHNQQYPPITVNYCQRNHNRFLIIDDVVYIFGASLKDAGKKLFAYIKMQETSATDLLNNIR